MRARVVSMCALLARRAARVSANVSSRQMTNSNRTAGDSAPALIGCCFGLWRIGEDFTEVKITYPQKFVKIYSFKI